MQDQPKSLVKDNGHQHLPKRSSFFLLGSAFLALSCISICIFSVQELLGKGMANRNQPFQSYRCPPPRAADFDATDLQCCAKTPDDLRPGVDNAILKLARVLARQVAREDHARELARSACDDKESSDLCKVFNRPAK